MQKPRDRRFTGFTWEPWVDLCLELWVFVVCNTRENIWKAWIVEGLESMAEKFWFYFYLRAAIIQYVFQANWQHWLGWPKVASMWMQGNRLESRGEIQVGTYVRGLNVSVVCKRPRGSLRAGPVSEWSWANELPKSSAISLPTSPNKMSQVLFYSYWDLFELNFRIAKASWNSCDWNWDRLSVPTGPHSLTTVV